MKGSERGFTLIEVMAALMVSAALLTVALRIGALFGGMTDPSGDAVSTVSVLEVAEDFLRREIGVRAVGQELVAGGKIHLGVDADGVCKRKLDTEEPDERGAAIVVRADGEKAVTRAGDPRVLSLILEVKMSGGRGGGNFAVTLVDPGLFGAEDIP